ncbi:GFA family protein [Pseudohalocynthiibacter aestuariivivens]|uniref:GFA family protein n=1 Tax=Pseudohalocynthiibacter aestuariivivens TaxID=1591409 RepID=A0ABV5JEW4_9RHOB|nr:GFA family protein [Pseudohalocynthiibacter aestuariivivens]MCK0101934.1 GFA family protein [Pseudohalocynthiibacter sp. F2068]
MANEMELTGRCMCGAVKIVATARKPTVAACHCNMCRQWSSGPFMGVNCQNAAFEGEESIGRTRSSDWAERGFCTKCGSNLFYHIIDSKDYQIAAGLFDDQSKLRMSLQVFTDSKPKFYEFSNETKMMTGAEVAASFGPSPK